MESLFGELIRIEPNISVGRVVIILANLIAPFIPLLSLPLPKLPHSARQHNRLHSLLAPTYLPFPNELIQQPLILDNFSAISLNVFSIHGQSDLFALLQTGL